MSFLATSILIGAMVAISVASALIYFLITQHSKTLKAVDHLLLAAFVINWPCVFLLTWVAATGTIVWWPLLIGVMIPMIAICSLLLIKDPKTVDLYPA
jgi:hypothetical protein